MSSGNKIVRPLLQELRLYSSDGTIKDSLIAKYVLNQFKKYQTTELQLCKAKEEMQFLGNTYLTYLQSLRKYKAINKDYRGKGERSIKETADMVGFKLPNDPK